MGKKINVNYFSLALKYYKFEKIMVYVNIVLLLLAVILRIQAVTLIITSVSIITVPIAKWKRIGCQSLADGNRRKDFMDNSFNTKLVEQRTSGYYDNDEQSIGLYKAFVNVFENSLFSSNIAAVMLKKQKTINILRISCYLAIIFISIIRKDFIIIVATVFNCIYCLSDWVTLRKYTLNVNYIYGKICEIFKGGLSNDMFCKRHLEGSVIYLWMEYEINIAQYCIMLDSKLFNEMNKELTLQWEGIKKEYHIT